MCRFCGNLPTVYRYMQNRRLVKVVIKCRSCEYPEGNICHFNRMNLVEMMTTWNKKQWENNREILISLEDTDRVLQGGTMLLLDGRR